MRARLGMSRAATAAAGALWASTRFSGTIEERKWSRAEVGVHDSVENGGVWVTYRNNVYDVTPFIDLHPGGYTNIMQAAGADVEGFFQYWAVHKQYFAQQTLAQYRIGELVEEDRDDTPGANCYVNEPPRESQMYVVQQTPRIAEPTILPHSWATPNHLFYIRNHGPVPEIESAEGHSIDVFLGDEHICEFTLPELETVFSPLELDATMQCTGNRLREMYGWLDPAGQPEKKWRGKLDSAGYQLGNARWSGVRLSDLLRFVLKQDNALSATHVEFHGADGYFNSVPLDLVLSPENDAMLATKMNGEPLPRDHGFPVRLLIPGVVGARNVKWVHKIVLSTNGGDSPWNNHFYNYPSGENMMYWPVCSMITHVDSVPASGLPSTPARSGALELPNRNGQNRPVRVQGFAYSGRGRKVEQVEVSLDEGKNWHQVEITKSDERGWAWSLWETSFWLPEGTDSCVLCSRGKDSSGTQPSSGDEVIQATPSGYLFNSIHKVEVTFCTP